MLLSVEMEPETVTVSVSHKKVLSPNMCTTTSTNCSPGQVYVMVRPGVHDLLRRLSTHYEIVIYTASLAKYADPLLDMLDKDGLIAARLFREHCVFHRGNYVKDLSTLGRRLCDTLIVDNSPASYM